MTTERELREQEFQQLVGRVLTSVVYLGAWRAGPLESGAYVEWIELATADSGRFRITTEADFGDHGLVILEGAVDRGDALKSFDATGLPMWARVVRSQVTGARVHWTPLLYPAGAMPGEPAEFPRDVVLSFDNRELVVLSAAGVGQDGNPVIGVDSVAAFSAEDARSLAILRDGGRP